MKSYQARLNDVYTVIARVGDGQDRLTIEALVTNQYPGDADKRRLSEALKLHVGWFDSRSDAAKRRRNAVRTVLLLNILQQSLDPVNNADLIRTARLQWIHGSTADCENMVRNLLMTLRPQPTPPVQLAPAVKQTVPTKIARDGVLAPSFDRANSMEKQLAKESFQKASELISRAWPRLQLASAGTNTKARSDFVRFFGPFDQARYDRVKEVLKKVHDTLVGDDINLYYRGSKVTGRDDDRPNAAPKAKADASTAFAYVLVPSPGPGTHVFLGKAFFNGTQIEHGNDSIGGVVIHELTHALCGTRDKKHPNSFVQDATKGKRNYRYNALTNTMVKVAPGTGDYSKRVAYGITLAKHLAANYPAKAVENADNYEYYCEQYKQ
jgi:hypothetical protein